MQYTILLSLVTSLTSKMLVESLPSCQTSGDDYENFIACTAGDDDYILHRGLVSDNSTRKVITLKACRIIGIADASFQGLPVLVKLDLSHNKIQQLKPGVLDGLRHLTVLNLSFNQLNVLSPELFKPTPDIRELDLKGNRIEEFEMGIFDPLRKLRFLNLSTNPLLGEDINAKVFDKTKLVLHLDFSRNDMSGTKDDLLDYFDGLVSIILDRCSLYQMPTFVTKSNTKNLEQLILSTNQIGELDDVSTFVNFERLRILDLSDNHIENIVENVFVPLKKLKTISLKGNKLMQIPEALFRNVPMPLNIDLSHNLIEFVPVNAFRGSPVKVLNLAHNRFSYLTDNFCLELKNSGGAMTNFYFNQNPWQCSCLKDIIEEVKKYGIQYNDAGYDGNRPVCLVDGDFSCKRQPYDNARFVDLFFRSNDE